MNIKRKTTITFGLIIVCLLFLSLNTNISKTSAIDNVTIVNVDFPEKVKFNSTFEVKVDFAFAENYVLYGNNIYLHYTAETETGVPITYGTISESVNTNDRDQTSYTFSVDTSLMELGEIEKNVKLLFTVKYSIGYYLFGAYIPVNWAHSEYYELTITKSILVGNLPIWAICLIVAGIIVVIGIIYIIYRFRK